jgi:hypothetical protein
MKHRGHRLARSAQNDQGFLQEQDATRRRESYTLRVELQRSSVHRRDETKPEVDASKEMLVNVDKLVTNSYRPGLLFGCQCLHSTFDPS